MGAGHLGIKITRSNSFPPIRFLVLFESLAIYQPRRLLNSTFSLRFAGTKKKKRAPSSR